VTGHEDYVVNDLNGLVVETGNEAGTVAAIEYLRDQPLELRRLQRGALETAARWPSWVESSRKFRNAIEVISRQPTRPQDEIASAAARGRAMLS
jgi:hypothetical protein